MTTPHRMITREVDMLSKAESKIYNLAVSGLTRDEIADETCRTRRSVNFHFENIFRKKGVNSHVKLIAAHYSGG